MSSKRANGRRRRRRRQEAGTASPALAARLTAGVGGPRLGPRPGGGSGQHREGLRQPGWLAQPRAVADLEAPPQAVEAEVPVDGGVGLWLRTWRRTRPAPSVASSAPASSRGSGSDAHAHPGASPAPTRFSNCPALPGAPCLPPADVRTRDSPKACSRPYAPWVPPRPLCARAFSRGLPASFSRSSNQILRGARSPGNTEAAALAQTRAST